MRAAIFGRNRGVLDHPGIPEKGSIPFPRVWRILLFPKHSMASFSAKWFPIFKFHLSFYLYGVDGSFFFRLPIVQRLPFKIQISLFVVVKVLFMFILFSIFRSVGLLFMDELTRAVAPFVPTLGGTNGGFGPPPAPSGDSSLFGFHSPQEQPGPSEVQARAPRTHTSAGPANPVASPEEAASPPPVTHYPYQADEVIGGDSISVIQSRLLANNPSPSFEEIERARIDAQDRFEVKVNIIRLMAPLDPEGDWEGRGARALDNPRTPTGEESLEKLYRLQDALNRGGVKSKAFRSLKARVFKRTED